MTDKNIEALTGDMLALGATQGAATAAATALYAAVTAGPRPAGLLLPAETVRALGVPDVEPDQAPSALFDRAAHALEWGAEEANPRFGDLGLLPTRYFTWGPLPDEVEKTQFTWVRVGSGGCGNQGWYVAARPHTPAARVLRRWFYSQTIVRYYGGWWWEAADKMGFGGMNNAADKLLAARTSGMPCPFGETGAQVYAPELRGLSGPRTMAFLNAVAPANTWKETPNGRREFRRLMATKRRLRYVKEIQTAANAAGMTFVPAR